MPAIQVSDELARKIEQGAQRTGESSDAFLQEAVMNRLEDLDDLAIALDRLHTIEERIPFEQVKRDLGLEN